MTLKTLSGKTLKTCRIPRLTQSKPDAIWKCKDRTRKINAFLFPLGLFVHRSFYFMAFMSSLFVVRAKTTTRLLPTPSAAFHRWEISYYSQPTRLELKLTGEKRQQSFLTVREPGAATGNFTLRSEGATLMAVEAIWMWCSLRRVLSLSMK